MNPLIVGLSYRTAPVSLLERLAISTEEVPGLLRGILVQPSVGEALVLSTCNRVEVYAGVSAFHAALTELSTVLAEYAQVPLNEFVEHLYVRYDDEAVRHTFRLAAGLDSMVVGEAQILGQLRDSYRIATDAESAGRVLHELMQSALRVGKRVHAETGIDRAGQSVVSAALALGAEKSGLEPADAHVLVVGAGAMGALACATLQRAGVRRLTVANRNRDRADRLVNAYGGTAIDFDGLPSALAAADIILCATTSPDYVLTALPDGIADGQAPRPKIILDLAVPRDVDPALGNAPGVILIDIERLGSVLAEEHPDVPTLHADVVAASTIVDEEATAYASWLQGAEIAPTVAALRARADGVVEAELRRLAQRCPALDDDLRAEAAHAMHRIVRQLLHQPTVRVRQLATEPGGAQYTAMVRDLFDLDVGTDNVTGALGAELLEGGAE
ncbi:MAG: glutamyl-tRNA reductase [Longispora sp.]|nr:glutamyl-tRNA reductase [Longispora sp. (in: high G+C Gram-positive bacteria)]